MTIAWKFPHALISTIPETKAAATQVSRSKTMIATSPSAPQNKPKSAGRLPNMSAGSTLSTAKGSQSKYVENFHGSER